MFQQHTDFCLDQLRALQVTKYRYADCLVALAEFHDYSHRYHTVQLRSVYYHTQSERKGFTIIPTHTTKNYIFYKSLK